MIKKKVYKGLHLGIDLFRIRFTKYRKPLFVTLRVTNRCNLNCIYCNFNKEKVADPSEGQIKKCITEFWQSGAIKFGFTGGEPLLRKDIGRLINFSQAKGLITTMTSNGWFVLDRIDELEKLNLLILSLDGVDDAHDKQRKRGSFSRVLQAIEMCHKNHIPVITLTVLTKYNINQINSILKLAKKYRFQSIFQPVESRDFFKDGIENIVPTKKEFGLAIKSLKKEKKKGSPVYNSFSYLKLLSSWPSYDLHLRCWAGKISCVVNTDGFVLPCNNYHKIDRRLNGFECGFMEAFQEMGKYNCSGCWTNCYQENNSIMNLSLIAINDAFVRLNRII